MPTPKDFSAGKVYVQVIPSLDGWTDDIEKQLAKATRSAKAKLTPTVEVDGQAVAREATRAAGYFASTFTSKLKDAVSSLPDIEVDADTSTVDKAIAGIRKDLEELSKKTVGVDIDDQAALAGLQALDRQLAALDNSDVTIQARVDTQAALAQLEGFRAILPKEAEKAAGSYADSFERTLASAIGQLPDITVRSDTSTVNRELAGIRAELVALSEQQIGLDIDDRDAVAKLEQLRERLTRLDRSDVDVKVRIDASAATVTVDRFLGQIKASGEEAERTLTEVRRALAELADRRVRLAIDASTFTAELNRLRDRLNELRSVTPSVTIKAETTKALADIEAVRAAMAQVDNSTVKADVNVNDHGSIDLLSTRLQKLIALAIAASGAIGGAAAGVVTLAAAATAGAAGLGALALGGGQIVAAMRAQTQASRQLGQTEAQEAVQRLSAANQVLSAQEALASASVGVANAQDTLRNAFSNAANAQRDAASSIRTALEGQRRAEESLAAAQISALRTQEALTDAKLDATRSIEDLRNQTIDDALAQRQAVLDLQDAELALQKVQANTGASERQREEAQLAFDRATQRLAEISLAYQRSQADAEKASAAGVEGSEQVIAAQDAVVASQRELRQAHVDLGEAALRVDESRVDGAEQVADAQREVVRAQRELAQSQTQVLASQRALGQAQAASAVQQHKQGAASEKLAEAMEKLSPQAISLIGYLRSQSGEWAALSKASQQFAPGLQRGLQRLQPFFGDIAENVGILSESTGELLEVLGAGLASSGPFFDTIAGASRTLFPRFGESLVRVASSVSSLVVQMLPLAPTALDTVDAISDLVSSWAPFIAQATGPLLAALQDIIGNLDFLGPLLVAIAKPAGDLTSVLVGGLREGFLAMMPELGDFLQSLVDIVATSAPLLGTIGQLAGLSMDVLTPAIQAANAVLRPLVDFVTLLVDGFTSLPTPISGSIGAFIALRLAAEPISRMMTGLGSAVAGFATKAAVLGASAGVSATAMSRVATTGSRVGTAIGKMGSAIPVAGAALIGLSEILNNNAEDAQRAQEKTDELGLALIRGGSAAAAAQRNMDLLRAGAENLARSGTDSGRALGAAFLKGADDVEESARRQRAAMSDVDIAQHQVIQAQLDYDAAVRGFGPTSESAILAQESLASATGRSKQAQRDAADAAKTYTERLLDQQNAILSMGDRKVAKDRAGLTLERSKLRVEDSERNRKQALADAEQAQTKLNQATATHGKKSDEAREAQRDYLAALNRVEQSELDIKEAKLDVTSAQSNYIVAAREAATAEAEVAGAHDTSAAATRGQNQALIDLMRSQGQDLPLSVLSMIAGMSDAEKAFFGLTVKVGETGDTILTLPGAPGQPPVTITFTDNIDHAKQRVIEYGKFLEEFWIALTGHQFDQHLPGGAAGSQALPRVGPDRFSPLSHSSLTPTKGLQDWLAKNKKAQGGFISGTGTGDTVPAMLTPGEFVFSRPAVARIGAANIASLHASARHGFASGGLVRPLHFAAGGGVPTMDSAQATPLEWLSALIDVFDEITTVLTPLGQALRGQLIPGLEATFEASATLAKGSAQDWANITAGVSNAVNTITGVILPSFRAGLSLVDQAVANTASVFAVQFGLIRGYASEPVRWTLANPFNLGLVAAWNTIDTMFAVGKPLAPLPIPFAVGGQVSGGRAGKDSVLAALMPGEFVVPVPMVRQIGMGNLEAARRSVLRGGGAEGLIPGYEAGGAVGKALAFAASQVGKPYVWGGVGPAGYDCSGLVSAVTNVLLGLPPYARRFTTADFAPGIGAGGFLPGMDSSWVIGVSGSHMSGTLAGHNIESTTKNGISGVRVDGDASGATHPQYTKGQFYLPQAGGTFIPGPASGTPFDWLAMLASTFADTRAAIARIIPSFGANTMAAGASAEMGRIVDVMTEWAKLNLIAGPGVSGVAGTGPVADQVRAVAARYGWGVGPQWDALSTLIAHESSWNPSAQNPRSTAFGLMQFLDSTWGATGIPKTSNPTLQAEAGMRYIQSRYGDPSGAWRFWQQNHWYDQGGYLPPGLSLAYNGTRRPEPVLTSQQWKTMAGGKGGGTFTGTLQLDSGEFLGVVQGQIAAADHATAVAVSRRTR